MKVQVAVLDSPYLIVLIVFVDVKQHDRRAQEMCEKSRWPSWVPVPNSPDGLCGHKAT